MVQVDNPDLINDERASSLADLVLDYSVEAAPGDRLLIQFDPRYSGYATLVGKKARLLGAEVMYDSMSFDSIVLRGLVDRYDKGEWAEELSRRTDLASWCNSRVLINCIDDPDYTKGIENGQERVADFNRIVVGPYKDILYRSGDRGGCEVKWNIVGFPFNSGARDANMSLGEYADFVYSATLGNNWREMKSKMDDIKSAFDNAKDVHLIVPGFTDLHLSLKGRGGEICDGRFNMPDGEVCYGPIENSANGKIYFQVPTRYSGFGVIQGIELEFEDGEVIASSARHNGSALSEILNVDDGARRIGELGIGCNSGIKRPALNTLFDEKIGGTVHLALGDSFRDQPLSDGGGLNKSGIHWDIVCDLRNKSEEEYSGGEIHVDGQLVQKDGKWVI